jgi:hypothetical protein
MKLTQNMFLLTLDLRKIQHCSKPWKTLRIAAYLTLLSLYRRPGFDRYCWRCRLCWPLLNCLTIRCAQPSDSISLGPANGAYCVTGDLERIAVEWNISSVGEIVGAFLGVERARMSPRAPVVRRQFGRRLCVVTPRAWRRLVRSGKNRGCRALMTHPPCLRFCPADSG